MKKRGAGGERNRREWREGLEMGKRGGGGGGGGGKRIEGEEGKEK